MPRLRTYKIFISHCWEYDADYHTLKGWFDTEPLFRWKDLSVTEASPLREDKSFEKRLRKRLTTADIMVVVVGMEIAHRHWIDWEIRWAKIRGIPMLGVLPYARSQTPVVVQKANIPIVAWRRQSVIPSVRYLALNQ